MMNNKKNRKIPLMIYPCIVGFCLFLTSAIVGCFVTQSGVSFIILAVVTASIFTGCGQKAMVGQFRQTVPHLWKR